MNEIALARNDLEQAVQSLKRALDRTPDDRLQWQPSETARSPIALAAHSALALGFILKMLQGTPYPKPTMAEADAEFLVMEADFVDRAAVTELLDANFGNYCQFLDNLDKSQLDDLVRLPFELGHAPMRFAIRAGAMHTQSHASQLEYLQTIYGDRVW